MSKIKRITTIATSVLAVTVLLAGCGKNKPVEKIESTPETKSSFEKAIKGQAIAESKETETQVVDYYTNGIKVEVEKAKDEVEISIPTEKYVRDRDSYTKVSEIKADEVVVVNKGIITGVVKKSDNKPIETKAVAKVKPVKKYKESDIKYDVKKHTKKEYEEITKRDVSKPKIDTDDAVKKSLEAESKKTEIPKVVEKTTTTEKKEEPKAEETKAREAETKKAEEIKKPEVPQTENQVADPQPEAPEVATERVEENTPTPEPQPSQQPSPQPQTEPQPAPTERVINWVAHKTVIHHPEVTHEVEYYESSDEKFRTYNEDEMEKYIFDQADKGIFVSYGIYYETVVDKPAWDEEVIDYYYDPVTGERK